LLDKELKISCSPNIFLTFDIFNARFVAKIEQGENVVRELFWKAG